MYSRFRDGLLAPRAIVNYIKDKWYKPLLQILLYALLMTVPSVINILTYDGLSYEQKVEIRQVFNGDTIPFKIIDGQLESDLDDDTVYKKTISDLISVVISENDSSVSSTGYVIILSKTGISIKYLYVSTKICDYNDYEKLANFDLNDLGVSSNVTQWDTIFTISNQEIKNIMQYTIVTSSILAFFEGIFFIVFFAMIISFSFWVRFRNILKYSAMFKMSVYYTAPFVVCYVLSSLFSIGFLYYVGIILSFIYSIVGSTTIISRLMNQGRK